VNCYHFATIWIVQSIYRRLISHRQPLSVGVHGQLYAGVPELALHVGRALALLEQQGGEGVTEAVFVLARLF
jgi:hypothetical protein